MNWASKEAQIGNVKVGSKKKITFKAAKDLQIKEVKSGCSCSKPKWNPKEGELSVIYTAKRFPKHLSQLTSQSIQVSIRVYYEDSSMEYLYIKGTKKR
jgi:hypothetical protein